MKFFYLKKTLLLFTIIIFVVILITVFLTVNINKKNENNNQKDEINIQITDPDECECENLDRFKEKYEFLKEQYKNKKLVALTFDDGPSEYTNLLVDELKKRNIPATFFILGSEAQKRPDTLKFAYDAGNEIAIHSFEHKQFTKLNNEELLEQISKCKNIIFEITGEKAKLIRVPYGALNKNIKNTINDNELTSVLWNVDSLDWKFKNTNNTYNYVMKKFKGNDVILMHDTFKTSIEAATLIMDTLQSKCYTFVTVSDFLKIRSDVKNN